MSLKSIEELTRCFFCKIIYNIPKILPCGFSICLNCSEKYSQIDCRLCNGHHALKDLITNQSHKTFLDLMDEIQSQDTNTNVPVMRKNVNEINTDNNEEQEVLKINLLNNEFNYVLFNLSPYLSQKPIHKSIKPLNKRTVLLIEERFIGKISTTVLNVIDHDGSIVRQHEENNHLTYYFCDCVNDKYILLVFRKGRNEYFAHFYDYKFNLLLTKDFQFEIEKFLLNDTNIYTLASEKKTYVREYNFELVKLRKFGQNKHSKKSFYIKGEIFRITSDKIYTKFENDILVLTKGKGDVLLRFSVDELKTSIVYVDNFQNFLVYNRFNRLSMYNQNGVYVTSNKIRYPEIFDEFLLTNTNNYVFVNKKNNFVLIV